MDGESVSVIRLSGDLSLKDGKSIIDRLREAIDQGPSAVVDCGDAASIDAGVLQLLVSAQKSARRFDKSLRIRIPAGGAVAEALTRSGIAAATDFALIWDDEFWVGLADRTGSAPQ